MLKSKVFWSVLGVVALGMVLSAMNAPDREARVACMESATLPDRYYATEAERDWAYELAYQRCEAETAR